MNEAYDSEKKELKDSRMSKCGDSFSLFAL